jgi:hypothetical protein
VNGDPGENDVEKTDQEVRDAEQEGVVSKRAGYCKGDDQHRGHGCEHRQSDAALVDVHRARQPGVSLPRPPERRENEHPVEDTTPCRVARKQARDLGEREHEDEVEEQLERGDLMLGLALVLTPCVGHAPTLDRTRDL